MIGLMVEDKCIVCYTHKSEGLKFICDPLELGQAKTIVELLNKLKESFNVVNFVVNRVEELRGRKSFSKLIKSIQEDEIDEISYYILKDPLKMKVA